MRDTVAARFDRARDYDAHARVQRHAAASLAAQIAARCGGRAPARILEIGCGTGLLTQAVRAAFPVADYLATDISDGMLARFRQDRLAAPVRTRQLDAQTPETIGEARFDLICGSLCMQWFADRRGTLSRLAALLAPGGVMAFSTLADGTFAQWRVAHHAAGLPHAGYDYPALDQLAREWPGDGRGWTAEMWDDAPGSGLAFARDLRAIGADLPRAGHRPLGGADLRRVMARFDAMGATVTYHLAYGVFSHDTA